MNPVSLENISEEPGFKTIRAVREGRFFHIKEQLVSRPTLRIIEGIRQIASLLYPEHFPAINQGEVHGAE